MYRNLDAVALGISGRQSELIELALTYGFSGLDVDIASFLKRARNNGVEQACRFMNSAGLAPVSSCCRSTARPMKRRSERA